MAAPWPSVRGDRGAWRTALWQFAVSRQSQIIRRRAGALAPAESPGPITAPPPHGRAKGNQVA